MRLGRGVSCVYCGEHAADKHGDAAGLAEPRIHLRRFHDVQGGEH